jgi:hypothetical protein
MTIKNIRRVTYYSIFLFLTEQVGEAVKLYACIRWVLGSNLGQITGCPKSFLGSSQLHENSGPLSRLSHESLLPYTSQFIIH